MNFNPRWMALALVAGSLAAQAGVTAEEAAHLGKDLTPSGAERAGNKAGTIPEWNGGYAPPNTPRINGRRPDPFASDKVLYSVTAKNMSEHAAVLTDGLKAMFAKYPDFRMDVYQTRRTATWPAYVQDNMRKNATRASLDGYALKGAYGGIPFPIPKSGTEAMWNSLLHWEGANYKWEVTGYQVTADAKPVQVLDAKGDNTRPFVAEGGSPEAFEKDGSFHFQVRILNVGPPVRAGEAFLQKQNLDPTKDDTWLYLTGQRRVRKLPNACCDTPAPQTAGIMSFDEMLLFTGRLDRMDWKLVGKQEMLIPYNSNRLNVPAHETEVLGKNFLKPEHVRWELHRVWVVESTVRQGQRHIAPRSRYYLDEDSWIPVLADRWDAKGQLWRVLSQYPMVVPDLPGVVALTFGMYDMIGGSWFMNGMMNSKQVQILYLPPYKPEVFTPESLAAENVR